MDKDFDSKTQVDLSELLQLKRLERPADDYWSHFQRELHHKTLQTIVQKQPDCCGISRFWTHCRGICSALAALTFACVLYFLFSSPQVADQLLDQVALPDSPQVAMAGEAKMSHPAQTANLLESHEFGDPSFVVAAFTVDSEQTRDADASARRLFSSPDMGVSKIHYAVGHFAEMTPEFALSGQFLQ